MVLILITFSIQGWCQLQAFLAKKYLLKKNNDRLTAKQAQNADLDPSLRKEAKFEENPIEVAKWTYDLPNRGALQ
jgi:hypothetical protein